MYDKAESQQKLTRPRDLIISQFHLFLRRKLQDGNFLCERKYFLIYAVRFSRHERVKTRVGSLNTRLLDEACRDASSGFPVGLTAGILRTCIVTL